jgi:hypothetical protein
MQPLAQVRLKGRANWRAIDTLPHGVSAPANDAVPGAPVAPVAVFDAGGHLANSKKSSAISSSWPSSIVPDI